MSIIFCKFSKILLDSPQRCICPQRYVYYCIHFIYNVFMEQDYRIVFHNELRQINMCIAELE